MPNHYQLIVPRCITCGYALSGLPNSGRCPECSRDYDLEDPRSYTIRVRFNRWRFWLPGLCLAIGASILCAAILTFTLATWEVTVLIAAPLAIGCILGYRMLAKWFVIPFVAVVVPLVLLSIIFLPVMMSPSLYFPSAIKLQLILGASSVLFGPICFGTAMGVLLRVILKRTSFSQRSHLPVLAFVAMPVIYKLTVAVFSEEILLHFA